MAKKKQILPTEIRPKFWESLKGSIPDEKIYNQVCQTFQQRPTTIRLNSLKADPKFTLQSLSDQGFQFKQSTFSDLAYSLQNKSKRELIDTQEYEQGHIYIQSYASQVPPLAMDIQPGQIVLDLTAAPGSKTSQIAGIMDLKGELHANDVSKVRFFKLKHNLEKLGVTDTSKPQNDQFCQIHNRHGGDLCQKFPDNYFDRILLDAPCSGECRFVEDRPKTFQYWSHHKVKEMVSKQKKLLQACWPKLKPGGILVYSTCTFAVPENEKMVNHLYKKFPDQPKVIDFNLTGLNKIPSIIEYKNKQFHPDILNTLRIMPTDEIEGFFIAKIQKNV